MKILSVDPAFTSFAYVIYDTETNYIDQHKIIKFKARPKLVVPVDYDCLRLAEFYNNLIKINNVDMILCEGQFVSKMSEPKAIVKLVAGLNSIPYHEIHSRTWQKATLGKGNLPRIEVKKQVKEKIPKLLPCVEFLELSQDELDACAFALAFTKLNNLN